MSVYGSSVKKKDRRCKSQFRESKPIILMMLVLLSPWILTCVEASTNECDAHWMSGDLASVTCRFPQDLNKTKQGFGVIQYGNDGSKTGLTLCYWEDNEPKCLTDGEGDYFQLDDVSDTFTVVATVRKATVQFACDIMPKTDDVLVKPCNLTQRRSVKPRSKDAGDYSTATATDSSLNTTRLEGPSQYCHAENYTIVIVVLIVIIIALIVVVTLLTIYVTRLRRRTHDKRNTEESSSANGAKPKSDSMESSQGLLNLEDENFKKTQGISFLNA